MVLIIRGSVDIVYEANDMDLLAIACNKATAKLQRIIDRYGDDGGERLKPDYIRQLVAEQLQELAAQERYGCKRKETPQMRAPLKSNSIVAQISVLVKGVDMNV